jgi:hypothetical protein
VKIYYRIKECEAVTELHSIEPDFEVDTGNLGMLCLLACSCARDYYGPGGEGRCVKVTMFEEVGVLSLGTSDVTATKPETIYFAEPAS